MGEVDRLDGARVCGAGMAAVALVALASAIGGCCFVPDASGGSGGSRARGAAVTGSAAPSVAPSPSTPATPVTACAVDDAYRANEIAAASSTRKGHTSS